MAWDDYVMDADETKVVVVCKDKLSIEQMKIDAQWPEDREAYIKLMSPTNLTELGI